MNPLPPKLRTGALGELLVQIRLLEYDIQAVAPHKDTGNDLLAIADSRFYAIQVKTSAGSHRFRFSRTNLMKRQFHFLALVRLSVVKTRLRLDESEIYILPRSDIAKGYYTTAELSKFRWCRGHPSALLRHARRLTGA